MDPDWVRSLRDQCADEETPFFFKQWGEFRPGTVMKWNGVGPKPDEMMHKVGKGRAGRMLDGREWSEFPGEMQ